MVFKSCVERGAAPYEGHMDVIEVGRFVVPANYGIGVQRVGIAVGYCHHRLGQWLRLLVRGRRAARGCRSTSARLSTDNRFLDKAHQNLRTARSQTVLLIALTCKPFDRSGSTHVSDWPQLEARRRFATTGPTRWRAARLRAAGPEGFAVDIGLSSTTARCQVRSRDVILRHVRQGGHLPPVFLR